jgi:hypothetical protein
MASYITITDAETDPEAPLTSELAKKWRDNPIAITEGATGAPKIQKKAMGGLFVGSITTSGTTWAGLTGLANFNEYLMTFAMTSGFVSGSNGIEIRFSTDNGSTWGTAQNLVARNPGAQANTYMTGTANFNVDTGQRSAQGLFLHGSVGEGTAQNTNNFSSLPSGINGLQIRGIIGSPSVVAQVWVLGAR